jgi:HK97 family phage portal protein
LRADVSGTPAPWDDYWYEPLGNASSSGMRIDSRAALRDGTVLACVGVIARNVGTMPCKIYTQAPDGSTKLVTNHPLYDVLYSRPNDQQTAFEFKQMMQGHLELRGNAYAEIVPGPRGPVDQLIPMHPDRVHVERIKPSGKLRYRYDDPLTGTTRTLMQEEVFALRNFSDNGYTGQSTIAMACDLIGMSLAQQDYSSRFLKNDARPPIVFENTNFKTKEDDQRFLSNWQKGVTRANRGKAALLPAGVTIKELGVTPIDQQLLDAAKFSRIKICSIFGVPPHLIGETEKTATYASVEQFNIIYAVHCILPRLIIWEQAIQRDLITSPRYFAKYSMASLLRGDTAARFAAYQVAIGNGWMCQDEVRLLEDMNPMPNGVGRRYWRPANWLPLDQVAVSAQSAASTSESDTDDPNVGETGETDAGGNDSAAQQDERLKLLAASAADRCVRKEVAALRKMVERSANDYQLEEFYAEHIGFVKAVLSLEADAFGNAAQNYFARASELAAFIAADDKGAAYDYIDRIAATESLKLAAIAVGGKQ